MAGQLAVVLWALGLWTWSTTGTPLMRDTLRRVAVAMAPALQRVGSCDPLDPWDILRGAEDVLWGLWSVVVGVASLFGFTMLSALVGLALLAVVVVILLAVVVYGVR